MRSILRAGVMLALSGLVACGGGDSGINQPPPTPAISGLTVAPTSTTLLRSQTVTLQPTPSSAGAGVSVTYSYASNAVAVATVSANGVVTAVAAGTAVITVTATGSGTGFTTATQTATSTITVTEPPPVVVAISPTSLALNVGESGNLSVQITGGLPTPTLSLCTTSNAAIATATRTTSSCVVTAVSAGNATITAETTTGQRASATITVAPLPPALQGLTVTPTSATLVEGGRTTLVPNAVTAGAAVSVAYAYASSATSVATVSTAGEVTAVAPGQARITVTAIGSGSQFTTTTRTAEALVTVTAAPPAFDSLIVSPQVVTLAAQQTVQIAANVSPIRNGVTLVRTFSSSAPAVAEVSSSGSITAVAPGTATIVVTATGAGAGFSSVTRSVSIPVTVTVPPAAISNLTVAPNTVALTTGESVALAPNVVKAAPAVTVSYSYASNNSAVATVNAADGRITAVAPGSALVTVTASGTGTGFTATTLTTQVPVTVSNPPGCRISDRVLDFSDIGAITSADCLLAGNTRALVTYYRVTVPQPRVIQLVVDNAPFAPSSVVIARDTGTRALRFENAPTVSQAFFIPVGTSLLGVVSPTGAGGSYRLQVATQSEDVENCRSVMIAGDISTAQRLSAASCVAGTVRYDEFYLFSPTRSCTIEMRRTGLAPMADPYLEAWNGVQNTVFAQNNDLSGATFDARLTLNNCVDANGDFIKLRARSNLLNDYGQYTLTVTFGTPIP